MFLSVSEVAEKWNISQRSVRNYCSKGMIDGAFITGKTWNIPQNATKPNPSRKTNLTLLDIMQRELSSGISGGIYHKVQVDLTYNSNRMEGSKLSHDETRYIFETNTIGMNGGVHNVDDIVETANHFRCIDAIITKAKQPISEKFIKQLHATLKSGTSDSRKSWFGVGEYKKLPNEIGGRATTPPEKVKLEMAKLLEEYNNVQSPTIQDIVDFHYKFEKIHPFQDGNGRVGRLIMFKECLKNNIVPFIIDEECKIFYYRGLNEYENEKGYLVETCLSAQDKFKLSMNYFKINYITK